MLQEILENAFKNDIINEVINLKKKLKDRIKDGDVDKDKFLSLGKFKGYNIVKSIHTQDYRNGKKRDTGVPDDYIFDIIKEVFSRVNDYKDTAVVFKYEDKYNVIFIVKKPKYKEVIVKTMILQNRNKNNYYIKDDDDKIILENLNLEIIFIKEI